MKNSEVVVRHHGDEGLDQVRHRLLTGGISSTRGSGKSQEL
ncbi:hypothetical protein GX50_03885 [[Emmonsia] crescens]|uniref:Uncharacterized protein n=1 Tax=[Emmonsia] crescens TaxID=73230 RepID=A0A2B7ZK07_9EURO|nr:hypothetical protein GX50_03885 [Emmonsia crescens]